MCRGNPRTRSPLPRLRLRGCLIRIGLRSVATGPRPFGARLDFLIDFCRSRFRCRQCRGHRWRGLPTEPKLLRQSGALLGIGGGREGMIAPQPPPPSIFISIQAVTDAEKHQEAPRQLDHAAPHAGVARWGQPLLPPPRAALIRRTGQAGVASDSFWSRRWRDRISCTSMSAVSMPTPTTRASSRTIA